MALSILLVKSGQWLLLIDGNKRKCKLLSEILNTFPPKPPTLRKLRKLRKLWKLLKSVLMRYSVICLILNKIKQKHAKEEIFERVRYKIRTRRIDVRNFHSLQLPAHLPIVRYIIYWGYSSLFPGCGPIPSVR